jgi:hypothetical protein
MFVPVKDVVLITVVLKALKQRMILGWVAVKMESPFHRASHYLPKRNYSIMPSKRLANSITSYREQQEEDYAKQECCLHLTSPPLLFKG